MVPGTGRPTVRPVAAGHERPGIPVCVGKAASGHVETGMTNRIGYPMTLAGQVGRTHGVAKIFVERWCRDQNSHRLPDAAGRERVPHADDNVIGLPLVVLVSDFDAHRPVPHGRACGEVITDVTAVDPERVVLIHRAEVQPDLLALRGRNDQVHRVPAIPGVVRFLFRSQDFVPEVVGRDSVPRRPLW